MDAQPMCECGNPSDDTITHSKTGICWPSGKTRSLLIPEEGSGQAKAEDPIVINMPDMSPDEITATMSKWAQALRRGGWNSNLDYTSELNKKTEGVWIAYYADKSQMVPFATEVEALRYAVENSMTVKFLKYGEEL